MVSSKPNYYDTIDSIYENKEIKPHFLKGHYTIDLFRNHYGNPKLKEIYQRTMKCERCVNDDHDYMYYVFNEVAPEDRAYLETHVAIGECKFLEDGHLRFSS